MGVRIDARHPSTAEGWLLATGEAGAWLALFRQCWSMHASLGHLWPGSITRHNDRDNAYKQESARRAHVQRRGEGIFGEFEGRFADETAAGVEDGRLALSAIV